MLVVVGNPNVDVSAGLAKDTACPTPTTVPVTATLCAEPVVGLVYLRHAVLVDRTVGVGVESYRFGPAGGLLGLFLALLRLFRRIIVWRNHQREQHPPAAIIAL